jgi:hypothetical protein
MKKISTKRHFLSIEILLISKESLQDFTRSSFLMLLFFSLIFILAPKLDLLAQSVTINATTNNVPITEVELEVQSATPFTILQTSPSGNTNPSPSDVPVLIKRIRYGTVSDLYPIAQIPTASNFHPNVGNVNTSESDIQVALADGTIIQHRIGSNPNPAYFTAIENVISTADLRSYWDLGGGALGSAPQRFMDVRFANPIKPDAKLAITERWGNTPMHFQALDINGNVIAGSNTVFIGGASKPDLYQWNTGVNHSVVNSKFNFPSFSQLYFPSFSQKCFTSFCFILITCFGYL